MKSNLKIFTPIGVSLAVAASVMVAALVGVTAGMDASAKSRQTDLLRSGLGGRVQEINHQVVTQVVWDDAVAHLDNHFDQEWAKSNIGVFLSATDGFNGAVVLDSADQPIYAMREGADVALSSYGTVRPAAIPLVAAVRSAEAKRVAAGRADWPVLMKTPIQATAFARIGEGLHLVTATLVQPDFGHAVPSARRAPIVITIDDLDDSFVSTLGGRFLLKHLHLANAAGTEGVALTGPSGEVLARLIWTPDQPGRALLKQALPVLLLFLILIAGAARVLYVQANKAAQSLIASEARATHMALHDFLTGLANRRLFSDRLTQALEQARRSRRQMAILCLDLDRFKEVNDTFGHQIGDELVQEVAARLHRVCRGADTLARLGGDEFAIVMSDGAGVAAGALAEQIIAEFQEPVALSAGSVQVSCSIGVAVTMEAEVSALELMRQADLALYRAKDLGRKQFCFFELEMDAALKHRRALERDLRSALAAGDIEMHYQPQVDGSGAMIGVEALARWTHDTRGAVSPAIFVQIAEECGLIGELGLYTLRRAFMDSLRWPQLKVAINVSARQISLPNFVEDVKAALVEARVPASRFELEITEGILLDDTEHTHDTLRRLKDLGFSLALDDFGTGYSSLSYLRRYPIDKIKIDRSFISNLGVDAEADEVVGAIIKLARALNLNVIAEGVETAEQRRLLVGVGCLEAQGYLFSRPITCDAVSAMVHKPRERGLARGLRRQAEGVA